ncbi:MAG: glycosyltransferase family 2 protein [Candidatus Diapherotrites archaeon]
MIAAIIPALNEEAAIEKVVKETRKFAGKVIVVSDGSTDRTAEKAEKAGAIVLANSANMGKGFASRIGVKKALEFNPEIIVLIDADLQHDPREIPKMVRELKEKKLDLVLGARIGKKGMPKTKTIGNALIDFLIRIFYGINLKDSQCGFKAIKKEALQKIMWNSNDYGMETEIAARIAKNKLKFKEVPIKTAYNDKYKGTSVIDGIKIFLNIIWWRIFI